MERTLFITTSSSSHQKMFNKTIPSFSKVTLDYVNVDFGILKKKSGHVIKNIKDFPFPWWLLLLQCSIVGYEAEV